MVRCASQRTRAPFITTRGLQRHQRDMACTQRCKVAMRALGMLCGIVKSQPAIAEPAAIDTDLETRPADAVAGLMRDARVSYGSHRQGREVDVPATIRMRRPPQFAHQCACQG